MDTSCVMASLPHFMVSTFHSLTHLSSLNGVSDLYIRVVPPMSLVISYFIACLTALYDSVA